MECQWRYPSLYAAKPSWKVSDPFQNDFAYWHSEIRLNCVSEERAQKEMKPILCSFKLA